PVIARCAREMGILTVGVVTKPFQFEGARRMRLADGGIEELHKAVDTLIVIPNQNLFRVANEKTTFADAFSMADQVLYSGVACITDLMVKEGLINLDFADVRAVMKEMGKAMMGTGEATGEKRALTAAEAAISNPLIDDASMKGARGLLVSITGGKDLTLYEVDEAATRIREEVDQDANIIVGATFDESLEGIIRVSVVATGIDHANAPRQQQPAESALKELAGKMRNDSRRIAERIERTPVAATASTTASAEAMESAAHAAVAAAILPPSAIEEVSIRPMPMKPSLFELPPSEAPQAELPTPATFIPPAPERTVRTQRMPRIDELPMPAQNEIKAQRGELSPEDHPEHRRLSLMQRLANVGLGRRMEEAAPPPAPRTARAMPQLERPLPRPTARHPEGRPGEPVSEYARRAAPQGLDPLGRPAAVHNSPEEDQLDIPAFLRRQAN
ncbi:MAG TPA: cell division protein FtsZ, partial [Pseudolabrys sp.]